MYSAPYENIFWCLAEARIFTPFRCFVFAIHNEERVEMWWIINQDAGSPPLTFLLKKRILYQNQNLNRCQNLITILLRIFLLNLRWYNLAKLFGNFLRTSLYLQTIYVHGFLCIRSRTNRRFFSQQKYCGGDKQNKRGLCILEPVPEEALVRADHVIIVFQLSHEILWCRIIPGRYSFIFEKKK